MNGKNICAILKKVNHFIISLNDLSDLFVGLFFFFSVSVQTHLKVSISISEN